MADLGGIGLGKGLWRLVRVMGLGSGMSSFHLTLSRPSPFATSFGIQEDERGGRRA